jgi:hypothetical protein
VAFACDYRVDETKASLMFASLIRFAAVSRHSRCKASAFFLSTASGGVHHFLPQAEKGASLALQSYRGSELING